MNEYIKHDDLLDIDYLDIEEYAINDCTEIVDMQLIKNAAIVDYVSQVTWDMSEIYIYAIHILDGMVKTYFKAEYENNVKHYLEQRPRVMRDYNDFKANSGLCLFINKTFEEIYNESISDPLITFEQLLYCLPEEN